MALSVGRLANKIENSTASTNQKAGFEKVPYLMPVGDSITT